LGAALPKRVPEPAAGTRPKYREVIDQAADSVEILKVQHDIIIPVSRMRTGDCNRLPFNSGFAICILRICE